MDADGFASLPLRSGAHRYFVSAGGSDSNGCGNGQQPATPLRTIAAAYNCVVAGAGDQVLLAEGSSFAEALPWVAYKSGYSAQYPTVYSSYDPSDPMNEAKYGRGDQRGARPVLTAPQVQIGNGSYGFIAIKGLDFNPGNVPNVGMMFVGMAHDLLIENNIFRYTGFSYDSADYPAMPTMHHLVVRNNSFYGMWNSANGRAGGVYASGIDSMTLEDNVFWHAGWKVGASRDDDYSVGGATVFSHSFYLQTNTTNAVVRRNLSADAAGDGGIARGDIVFTENLSIDNPACVGLGGGPQYNVDRPNGVNILASDNACFGDADVNSTHPLGWGISTTDGTNGSRVTHNLLARSRSPKSINAWAFQNTAPFNQPSYAQYDHNVVYDWAVPGQTYFVQTAWFPAQVFTSYDYNSWGDPASGTNINNSSVSFPNAYTAATLYAALGYADKNAFINYAINHPEAHIQRTARATLFAGYGLQ